MAYLGFDTSNYRTSVACVSDSGEILFDKRILLNVKQGERGLRQQEALFQHIGNLKVLMESYQDAQIREPVRAVAASEKPRPLEGSYMPVFTAGMTAAASAAAVLDVPCGLFSHQEGHIEAARFETGIPREGRFLAFHFSGGTTEAVLVDQTPDGNRYQRVGGSKDISYGQLLDRVGVALGMRFPAGKEMDDLVMKNAREDGKDAAGSRGVELPGIREKDGWVNLSGIESACQRLVASEGQGVQDALIPLLFSRIARSIEKMTGSLVDQFEPEAVLFAGGVSSSRYIRGRLQERLRGCRICFGRPELCSDNAVGTALLMRNRRKGVAR
ncbi:MAG: O-sialoglycoprotein endopeptidase [Anaerovoracaceae bacterium]|jgi:N6-L-threonylcarbamoyladenine synthase